MTKLTDIKETASTPKEATFGSLFGALELLDRPQAAHFSNGNNQPASSSSGLLLASSSVLASSSASVMYVPPTSSTVNAASSSSPSSTSSTSSHPTPTVVKVRKLKDLLAGTIESPLENAPGDVPPPCSRSPSPVLQLLEVCAFFGQLQDGTGGSTRGDAPPASAEVARSGPAGEVTVEFLDVSEVSYGGVTPYNSSVELGYFPYQHSPLLGLITPPSTQGSDMTFATLFSAETDSDDDASLIANASDGSTDFHTDVFSRQGPENEDDNTSTDDERLNWARASSPAGVGPSTSTSRPTAPESPPRSGTIRRRINREARLAAAAAGEARMLEAEFERPSEMVFTLEELEMPAPYVETDFDLPITRPIPGVPDAFWMSLYPRW